MKPRAALVTPPEEFRSVTQFVAEWALLQPDAPALRTVGGDVLTYGQFWQEMLRTREQMRALGIGPQDRVAAVMHNGPRQATALFALAAGCVLAPLHPDSPAEEIRAIIERLDPAAIIGDDSGEPDHASAAAEALDVPVLRMTARDPADPFGFDLAGEPVGPPADDRPTTLDDLMSIMTTSGTTGRAKLVAQSHSWGGREVQNVDSDLGLTTVDRTVVLTAIAHSHGRATIMRALRVGSAAIILVTPLLDTLPRMLIEHDPTWLDLVPAVLSSLVHESAGAGRTLNPSLRFIRSGTARLDPSLRDRAERIFGIPVVNAYGASEGGAIASERALAVGKEDRPLRVIRPLRIVDGDAPVPDGQPGEIEVAGIGVFSGYWDDPEATDRAFTADGWHRTGDRGLLTDGNLVLLGRVDDVINMSGAKVDPDEVDAQLLRFPGIVAAATFAVPHDNKGQIVAAAVVLEAGLELDRRALRRWLLARLGPHKVPTTIEVVDELPRTATGKVLRRDLALRFGDGRER